MLKTFALAVTALGLSRRIRRRLPKGSGATGLLLTAASLTAAWYITARQNRSA